MDFKNLFAGNGSAAPVSAPRRGPFANGATLLPGQSWRSREGRTVLTLDRTGQLLLSVDDAPVWKPPVTQRATKFIVDGRGTISLLGQESRRLWAVGVTGAPGAELHLQDDGNMVIYKGGRPIWGSGTNV